MNNLWREFASKLIHLFSESKIVIKHLTQGELKFDLGQFIKINSFSKRASKGN